MAKKNAYALPSFVKTMRLETLFIIIFLAFGIVFTFMVPPGWNTDEVNHTYRIYQLSKGDLLSEGGLDPSDNLKAYGGFVPQNLVKLFDKTGANQPGGLGNPSNKAEANLFSNQHDILSLKGDGHQVQKFFSGGALYSPATYIMYLPVFLLGNLLSIPFFWIIMLCRLIGLALTGFTFYLAIKYIPVGKWIIFAVGLVPGVIIQAQSVGADAPQLISCLLLITAVTKLLYEPVKLKRQHYLGFVILGAWLPLIKLAYAPFLLLLLALPLARKEYQNRKNVLLLSLVVCVSIIPSLIWTHMVSYVDINSNPHANFVAQKSFILHEPTTYTKTLYHTFFTDEQKPLENIFGSFVVLPAIYTYLGVATLAISLMAKSTREIGSHSLAKLNIRAWRISLLIVSCFSALLVATTVYIYSTPLYQRSISGIQSRYFLPLLPLILLAFYGNTARNQKALKTGIVVLVCVVLAGTLFVTYHRLYQLVPPHV